MNDILNFVEEIIKSVFRNGAAPPNTRLTGDPEHKIPSPSALGICVCLVAPSRPTLCDPMDWIPPGSSVHGIFQARILESVAISLSPGDLPNPGVKSTYPVSPALVGGFSIATAIFSEKNNVMKSQTHMLFKKMPLREEGVPGSLKLRL